MTETDEMRRPMDEHEVESGYPHTLRPELHRALDAAGVEYWVAQGLTFWNCLDGRECVAYGYQVDGKPALAVKIVGITDPAQAVEATLGPGTLSASQVSNAVYAHSIHADCADADWKAIADELNNTLGSSNCTNSEQTTTVDEVERIGISWRDGRHVTIHVMECSECGGTYEHVNGDYEFCPHCGRRIVRVGA